MNRKKSRSIWWFWAGAAGAVIFSCALAYTIAGIPGIILILGCGVIVIYLNWGSIVFDPIINFFKKIKRRNPMKKPTGKKFRWTAILLCIFILLDILNFMIDIPKPIYINTFLLLGTCFSLIVFILQRNNIIQ